MVRLKTRYEKFFFRCILSILFGSVFCACNTIESDLDGCPSQSYVRFKYDYNMQYADAFHHKVTAISLYLFDADGHFMEKKQEKGSVLADASYRMPLDLSKGTYQAIAIGGEYDGIFEIPEVTNLSDFLIRLSDTQAAQLQQGLPSLWFCRLPTFVVENKDEEQVASLIKNTNHIRIILQQVSGLPLSSSDFSFEITDDNGVLDAHDDRVAGNPIHYKPYVTGQQVVGATPAVSVAYAEFATSRLFIDSQAHLRIIRNQDQVAILDIPLIDYLMLLEMEGHKSQMGEQEYLDRQDEYSFLFFLDDHLRWYDAQIVINGWTIRLNNSNI